MVFKGLCTSLHCQRDMMLHVVLHVSDVSFQLHIAAEATNTHRSHVVFLQGLSHGMSRPRFSTMLFFLFQMKLMKLSDGVRLSHFLVKPFSNIWRKCRKNTFYCRDSTATTFRTYKSQQFQKQIKQDISHAALCAYLCTTWLPSHHVPFCDQGSGSHVLGRCLSKTLVYFSKMHPPSRFTEDVPENSQWLHWSRIHIPKKLPWDVLNPPDYIPPVVTWWWHCFPNPGTSPASSTWHQSENVQHTKSTIKKKKQTTVTPASFYMTPVHPIRVFRFVAKAQVLLLAILTHSFHLQSCKSLWSDNQPRL